MKAAACLVVLGVCCFALAHFLAPGALWSMAMSEEMNDELLLVNRITGSWFLTPKGVTYVNFAGLALVAIGVMAALGSALNSAFPLGARKEEAHS